MVRNIYESSNEEDNNENDPEYLPPPQSIAKTPVKDEPKSDLDSSKVEGKLVVFYQVLVQLNFKVIYLLCLKPCLSYPFL